MKREITYYLSLVLLAFSVSAQAQFTDDFSDGDFTNNPTWSGDTSSFFINAGKELQSNGPNVSGSKIYLSTPNASINNTEWQFLIDLKFNPTSTTFVRVYLVSDSANLKNPLNGYYIHIGETNADTIRLYKQAGSIKTQLFKGTTSLGTGNIKVRIKVTRDNAGKWTIFSDPAAGYNFVQEGSSFTDATYATTSFFGVYCEYSTASRYNLYNFDDFYAGPIITDTIPPQLQSASVISPDTIQLFFNEPMDSASLASLSAYPINNGIGNPVYAKPVAPNFTSAILALSPSLTAGTIYTVTVGSAVKDKAGNSIGSMNSAQFAIVQSASANDIVINEVMFDPLTNGVEWVEIYNRSTKAIDLRGVNICNMDTSGTFTNIKTITSSTYVLFPENYLALSKDQSAIKSQYKTTNSNGFIDMSSFISLSNDSAYIVLIDTAKNIIDKLYYRSAWHLPLLASTKGISLERINFDSPTQDKNNWHSAAESAGGATPAYKNSQYTNGESGSEITISPEVFSPDNDGYNDVLTINYSFDNPGMVGNVQIFDSHGRLIKNLIRNELLAASGTFFWDGITDEKTKARIGIFVVYFEAFDDKGNVKKYKKSCVVAGKL